MIETEKWAFKIEAERKAFLQKQEEEYNRKKNMVLSTL